MSAQIPTAVVVPFPTGGARTIECAGCGIRIEGTTPKRTALLYRAHRCGSSEPYDWANDDETAGTVAVHLHLTALEVNHMLAWLGHATAPRAIYELGLKVREQITHQQDR